MKQTRFFISMLLLVTVCFLANSIAQDYVHYVTLKGNTGIPTSVVFSLDSRTLANGSSTEMVYLWDIGTGHLKTSLRAGQVGRYKYNTGSVAYSPDGTTLAIGVGNGTVRQWDITARDYKAALVVDNGGLVAPIRYSPDGTILAVRAFTGPVGLWNPITGKLKTTLAGSTPRGHHAMAYSPDGKVIVTATYEGVDLWNAKTGQLKTSLTIGTETPVRVPGMYPRASVAYSPDGTTIAKSIRGNKVYLWDTTTGQLRTTLRGHVDGRSIYFQGDTIEDNSPVAYSPDGSTLAHGRDRPYNIVELWDTGTGSLKTTLLTKGAEPSNGVTCLAYSPDGRTLAVGYGDKIIRLWRVSSPLSTSTNPPSSASRLSLR